MSRVTKTVTVQASPETVIEYIADVENHPAFIGPLKRIDNLSGSSREVGTTWDWTFIMAGVEISGKAATVEYSRGVRYKYRTTSGIMSTFTYSVESLEGGSRLTMDVEYEVPGSVVDKVGLAVAERLNDQAGKSAAENIKIILE
jgi:ribosome-associated toxin RatA of RatAB toxin-antitoxin module